MKNEVAVTVLTEETAYEVYEQLFGEINTDFGYHLQVKQIANGILCIKHYSRNNFHSEEEDKVLLTNKGVVYRDNKEVAKFKIIPPIN